MLIDTQYLEDVQISITNLVFWWSKNEDILDELDTDLLVSVERTRCLISEYLDKQEEANADL